MNEHGPETDMELVTWLEMAVDEKSHKVIRLRANSRLYGHLKRTVSLTSGRGLDLEAAFHDSYLGLLGIARKGKKFGTGKYLLRYWFKIYRHRTVDIYRGEWRRVGLEYGAKNFAIGTLESTDPERPRWLEMLRVGLFVATGFDPRLYADFYHPNWPLKCKVWWRRRVDGVTSPENATEHGISRGYERRIVSDVNKKLAEWLVKEFYEDKRYR